MIRIALSSAWSRKRRLAGTAIGVVLGVSFLAATLILGDTARAGFSNVFGEANSGTDAFVRSSSPFTGQSDIAPAPLDATLVDRIRAVEGVTAVAATVEGVAQVVDRDGDPIGGGGPPTVGSAWIADPALTGWDVAAGRPPARDGEVVLDRATAAAAGAGVGDEVTVLVPEPVRVTVTGIATFAGRDSIGTTTYTAFTLAQAQRLLLGRPDVVTGVIVAGADGVTQPELADRLRPVLPHGVEVVTGDELTAEQEAAIEGDFLGFMTTGLLVFAGIALLVAAFSISNTFSILAAQKTRESALFRALGGSRRQVLGATLVESLIVGAVGSVAGVAAGVALAAGMLALAESAGLGLPIDGLVLEPVAFVVAAVTGIAVTLLGGALPAWKASRVAPLAALRDVAVDSTRASSWRVAFGALLSLAGAVVVLVSSSGSGRLVFTALGAVGLLAGVVLLGPGVARPVVALLGLPLRARGVSADLARRNAMRNPRRTAGSAAALLVGVGVVSLFTVFAASVSASIEQEIGKAFAGDLVVRPGTTFGGAGVPPKVLEGLRALPEVAEAAGIGYGPVTIKGEFEYADFSQFSTLTGVADYGADAGRLARLGDEEIAMSAEYAEEHGWSVGDAVPVGFADGSQATLTLGATYEADAVGGNLMLSQGLWQRHNPQASYFLVLIDLADGVPVAAGTDAVEQVVGGVGGLDVQDRDEFIASQAGEIDALLTVVYVLLAVAILIALMGIANTLSLSVHERTRELGLLRAVGQTRAQLRSMVRWESVLISTFGATGGVGLGLFLGWALVRSVNAAEGFGTLAVPVRSLAVVLLVGAVVGVVASLRPAWRASRMPPLLALAE